MAEMPPDYVTTLAINLAINVIYGFLVLRDWRRQPQETRKVQTLNTLGIVVALAFAQYFLAGYFYNMTRLKGEWNIPVDPLPIVFMIITTLPGVIALVLRAIKPKTTERSNELRELVPPQQGVNQSTIRRDLLRKGTHVAIFIAIFAIDQIAYYLFDIVFNDPFTLTEVRLLAWGYGAESHYILFEWRWEDWLNPGWSIAPSRIIVFGFLYCLTLIMLTGELCRHSRRWRFVFEKAIHRTMRPRELDRMGAYALFAAGFLLASLFLPYFGILGMLAGWSLGDLAASQVGMRWGRHRIRQQDKTWEGLIAGALVTFVAAWPFLGLAWAGVLTAAFVGSDLLTERPIPMSDNMLLPMVGVVVFTILQVAGIFVAPVFVALA